MPHSQRTRAETRDTIPALAGIVILAIHFRTLQKPFRSAILGHRRADQMPGFGVPSSSTETTDRSFDFWRACLRLRSHATFFRITRLPCTSVRVVLSCGSNTLTLAGSTARNSQNSGTPLYLNAASRTAFAVIGRWGLSG